MMSAYIPFCVLGTICASLHFWASKVRNEPSVGNNPQFLQFQKGYFLAYFPALLADWLQGPYLYKLYSHYGFQEEQIAVLYVCGFASSVVLGTWAPIAADRYGRKKLCIFFTIVYSLACFFKLSRSYWILLLGRVLGGVATSLLFSTFETWYTHEHIETNDFPKEWIEVTSNKANVWNGILAIIGGLVADMFSEWFGLGPISPFMLAIPCLLLSGIFVTKFWNENYSKNKVKFKKSCIEGLKTIASDPRICLIGIITALFESVMCIFVFIWTPILDPEHPSLGVIFSTYMVCILLGSSVFSVLASYRTPNTLLLIASILLALTSNILCVMATHPEKPYRNLALIAFFIFETAVGIYFPAMSVIRSRVVPDTTRRSVMNWFRVPMNLIACFVLMMLHDDSFRQGNRLIFVVSTILLAISCLGTVMYVQVERQYERSDPEESENGTLLGVSN